ncbi:MAG: type I-C CRISPR-associated protein Cas7/Csd2 [Methanomassiliicoccaceae archaeon]|jgi:CRISPR-associated protein Csd2|nr:type I-C CRISPR-associated protein Cas7/Csd2 [Methanomassiliicoccaceae archaeon]
MKTLENKIDFMLIFTVQNANPNGDPLNGNRPRQDYSGRGEISDVCLKRKIRNRMIDMGCDIFVQSDDKKTDDHATLEQRFDAYIKESGTDIRKTQEAASGACSKWIDVRSFGQLFAIPSKKSKKGEAGDGEGDKGVSIGVRGPVSIQSAFSVSPISISSLQITKSVSSTGDGTKRSSDTMGMKHRVDCGTYVMYGSINTILAKKTGFSSDDAEVLKKVLQTMFENDMSSARPEGTMAVKRLYWWRHSTPSGQYSSSTVYGSVKLNPKTGVQDPCAFNDYDIVVTPLEGLRPEIIEPL